ncbi:MAG: hypothetical protein ACRDZ5_00495 [Acidimicrobiales bacterium]
MINGLAGLVEQFTLPELRRVLRHTVLCGIAAGVICLVLAVLFSEAVFGLGICVGLGLGLGNIRLVTLQTAKVSEKKLARPIRALASLTIARLAITTVIVILLTVLVTPLGIGSVAGIALFYMLFVVILIASVLRHRGAPV